MNRSVDGGLRAEDACDTSSFTKKSTRDLSHSDRLILQKAISWAMGRMEFRANYDNLEDLKHAIVTQLERIGFKMPKVEYRPSFARNYVKFNIRRRLLAQGVQVHWNFGNKTLLPVDVGATDLETVSPPPIQNRRESVTSDFAIYSSPPSDEPEPACSTFISPPPQPPNEPEPVRSEVAPQFVSNRQERVSFNLKNRPPVHPATRNPPSLSNGVELDGSRSTPALAVPEAEVQDDDEDVYSMCKRTLSRLFTNKAGNSIVCPICEQKLR